ncbi:tripartite tricarboxylate transporter substrate binding protein [Jiangella asiatica]|uniref:Tripartite tricarboxylate transporter substrate binding protein n=1 Tax=Jiangella asiatica TaxID=2530372 RepID=A0A4R5CP42_9ACTN|nr:tripartite tricarboxylate transporter substrate binding protein [Jiangella asiatica]TDE01157.1 tripartite tricarboxylate transporter substrate binding protein [Jiangella asiatica]
MRLIRGLAVLLIGSALLTACASTDSGADGGDGAISSSNWPAEPITYLIGFAPGGGNDRLARLQQPILQELLGQNVNIEYMEGAGGAVGWKAIADASADGYMITVSSLPQNIVQPLLPDALYTADDIKTVAIVQGSALGLVVPPDSPYTSLDELLAAARANPGTLTIGGTGSFTASNLLTLRLQELTDTSFEYVSFEGGSAQITAFLGGQVDAIVTDAGDFAAYKDEGTMLAISSEDSYFYYPDVPTFTEQGVELVQYTERGLGVAADTPDEIVAKLEEAVLAAANDESVKAAIEEQAGLTFTLGADDAAERIAEETAIYTPLVEEALEQ